MTEITYSLLHELDYLNLEVLTLRKVLNGLWKQKYQLNTLLEIDVFIGFFSIGTGIFAFRTFPCNPWNPYPKFPLEIIYAVVTALFCFAIEIAWRFRLRMEKEFELVSQ